MDSSDGEDDIEYPDLSPIDFEIDPRHIRLLGRAGKGDDSNVYKAMYLNKWKVAVKTLRGSALVDEERKRFLRHAAILRRATHRNIVKFIGSCQDGESTMAFVLEFMKNCVNVEKYIRLLREDGEVMSLKMAVGIGLVTSAAMEFLHSKGIMHRNLKLSNVLISEDNWAVKLTGLSNAMQEIADAEEDFVHVYRPEYLALRAIEKNQWRTNERAMDIYAFGQLFYILLKSLDKDYNKNMNASRPLYLPSSEEGFPSMEEIPESLLIFVRWCLRGRGNFTVIVQSLDTYLEEIYNEERALASTTTTSTDSLQFATANLDNRGFINPSDLCYGPVISITPSATFYLAKYQSRLVVLKIIEKAEIEDVMEERRNKFDKQVAVLSRIEYLNIVPEKNTVQFIGSFREPTLTIVTEYMKGGTLERYLFELVQRPLYIKIAIRFALGICKAMMYLHTLRIVHRDLKTSNVFLTSDQDLVKLGGFGHAREDITDEMSMIPEASSSARPIKKHYDRKEDVYDFSRILWELLTNDGITFQKYMATPKGKRPVFEHVPDEMVLLMESCASEVADERPEFVEIFVTLNKLHVENPHTDDEDKSVTLRSLFKTEHSDSSTEIQHEAENEPTPTPEPEPEPDNTEHKQESKKWLCCATF